MVQAQPIATPAPSRTSSGTRATSPVHVWAIVGAILVAAEGYVVVKWFTGPNFQRVPVGPDEPPAWMRTTLDALQIVGVVAALAVVYWLLIRPWIRERTVTIYGIFVIVGVLAAPWDGVSGATQQWFNYNSYLFNRGSVLSELPLTLSPNTAGAGQAWPFFAFPAYIILIPLVAMLGSAIMRRAHRRFPSLGSVSLVVICILSLMAFEMALEMILQPLGVYSLAGGPWPLLYGNSYASYPFVELFHGGLFFSVPGILAYFVNDHGETIAERGAWAVRPGWRRIGIRTLAVVGAAHVCFILVYHLPVSLVALHSREYPNDVKQRSYFLGNTCGKAVNRACPGPSTPILRPGSGHLDWSGKYVPPGG